MSKTAPKAPTAPKTNEQLEAELPNVLMVKNLKGQTLKVNKAYYQVNSHKLTIVANA